MAKWFGKKQRSESVEVVDAGASAGSTGADVEERRYSRVGWWIVLVGVVGFGAWAALAPLDQGVPAPGTVKVSGNRQTVQNLVGGVVSDILVRNGDTVTRGDVLVRLDTTRARSEAEALRSQYWSGLALAARLDAERDGKEQITFPQTLLDARNDPRVEMAILTQQQLFDSRRQALQSEMDAQKQSIASLEADIQGLQSVSHARREQARLLQEQLNGMRDLAREGYVPRNRVLELERNLSQLQGDIAEAAAGIVSAQRRIGEIQQRMLQRQQEFQREVRTQLAEVQREVQEVSSRLEYADFELAYTHIRAPSDGVVVGLQIHTVGGVISSGTELMDLVPEDEPLVIEARVPVHLIDAVQPGLPVELMFTAFNQAVTPNIPGEVTTVSADRLVDESSGEPYYEVDVEVTPEGETLLADNQVRPGMAVEVLIKTGERSMLNYLFRPLLDRAQTSFVQE